MILPSLSPFTQSLIVVGVGDTLTIAVVVVVLTRMARKQRLKVAEAMDELRRRLDTIKKKIDGPATTGSNTATRSAATPNPTSANITLGPPPTFAAGPPPPPPGPWRTTQTTRRPPVPGPPTSPGILISGPITPTDEQPTNRIDITDPTVGLSIFTPRTNPQHEVVDQDAVATDHHPRVPAAYLIKKYGKDPK